MTTKYGELLLRQKYADLKAIAFDHDRLAAPLDNKDLTVIHAQHMRSLLKQLDWIAAVHRKEYPGSRPLDEEDEEQGNTDTPVGPTESLEDDTEGEQEGSNYQSPKEEFGEEDEEVPPMTDNPFELAEDTVQGDDADTMHDDAIPAATDSTREAMTPDGDEALEGMRLGSDNDMDGDNRRNPTKALPLTPEQLHHHHHHHYNEAIEQGHGHNRAIQYANDMMRAMEASHDDGKRHARVMKTGDQELVNASYENLRGYMDAPRQLRSEMQREVASPSPQKYHQDVLGPAHAVLSGDHDARHPMHDALVDHHHHDLADRVRNGDHEGVANQVVQQHYAHPEVQEEEAGDVLLGKKDFDGELLVPKEAQRVEDYLDGGKGSADLLDGPEFLSPAMVNEEMGYEQVKKDEKAIAPRMHLIPGVRSPGVTMPSPRDLHPVGTRVMTPGGEGQYSHHAGSGRHLVEHEGGDRFEDYADHEITPIKDEKAIVRMVQVKEHMRKMPERKKLSCPGCGQQDCDGSCNDQEQPQDQQQEPMNDVGGDDHPMQQNTYDDAMAWLESLQNKDYLTEEDKFLAFHFGKALETEVKSIRKDAIKIARRGNAMEALRVINDTTDIDSVERSADLADTADELLAQNRHRLGRDTSASHIRSGIHQRARDRTEGKSNHFHKDVEEGHHPGQEGDAQYLGMVYDTLAERRRNGVPEGKAIRKDVIKRRERDEINSIAAGMGDHADENWIDDHSDTMDELLARRHPNRADELRERGRQRIRQRASENKEYVTAPGYGASPRVPSETMSANSTSMDEMVKELLASVSGKAYPPKPKAGAATAMGGQQASAPVKKPNQASGQGQDEPTTKSLEECVKFFFTLAREKAFSRRQREEAKEVAGALSSIRGAVAKREKAHDPRPRKSPAGTDLTPAAIDYGEEVYNDHIAIGERYGVDQSSHAASMRDQAANHRQFMDGIHLHDPQMYEGANAERESIHDPYRRVPEEAPEEEKSYDLNSLVKELQETLARR